MEMNNVILSEISTCSLEHQKAVRDVRNHASIREQMYTDHVIGLEDHMAWLTRLENDKTKMIFLILKNDHVRGLLSMTELDVANKKSDWGFYLDTKARGAGLGTCITFVFLNFAFDDLRLEKLNIGIIETNPGGASLQRGFGFIDEGFRRSNIHKNDVRVGINLLGITRQEWIEQRDVIYSKKETTLEKYDISLKKPDLELWHF